MKCWIEAHTEENTWVTKRAKKQTKKTSKNAASTENKRSLMMENCVSWQTTVRLPAWIISRLENNLEASMTKALHTERLSLWLEKKGRLTTSHQPLFPVFQGWRTTDEAWWMCTTAGFFVFSVVAFPLKHLFSLSGRMQKKWASRWCRSHGSEWRIGVSLPAVSRELMSPPRLDSRCVG